MFLATLPSDARSITSMTTPPTSAIRVSPELTELGQLDPADVLRRLETSPAGISGADAVRRLGVYGPNEVAAQRAPGWPLRLLRTCVNPLVILLAALATVSLLSGDRQAASVVTIMILLGVTLRFVQESRANAAAEQLKAMIRVTATVLRDGVATEVPLRDLVPGDLVQLSAGDMIPADIRLLEAKDLFINQASLTGESLPVEKTNLLNTTAESALELPTLCFLGTSVESGTATAVVVTTGAKTYFGRMARSITQQPTPTAFDRGVSQFTWLMIGLMSVMVPLVFVINGLTKHDWREAFFFALAVAVGLTPEMLPMIVSVCLSKGAMAMSRKAVIVKRLSAIQNFGAMDVLCTDKTGTLTMDQVILERYCDVAGTPNDTVLQLAVLISAFQTGLKNVLDRAILDHHEPRQAISTAGYRKLDEIPFDFTRKLMSVVVATPDGTTRLVSKGAPEEIFKRCGFFDSEGTTYPIEPAFLEDLREEYLALSTDGFRVLAVAYRTVAPKAAYGKDDETDLVLAGYVAFLDPPKDSCAAAISALEGSGVHVKILTGDNDLVTRKICSQVGVATDHMLLGSDVERLSDAELAQVVEATTVFARVSPAHKQRIITALQATGHVVGFLGDGINDAPALRTADVGISVDTAVDVAKASADIILLQKSLMVLHDGVLEGRKVFSNILKYVRMGASSNFGNMFSVLGASAWLPFVPMAPIQVLTNNLLYDFSQVPIPTDNVDPEQIAAPRPWAIGQIRRFILLIGPISSIFDYSTFLVMFFLFHAATPARASLFQTGWFVESLMTQTLIIHVIRTNKIPFLQSRPSWPLIATTVGIMAVGLWLPVSPFAAALGFVHLPGLYWPILLLTLAAYMGLTQGVKAWMLRRAWI